MSVSKDKKRGTWMVYIRYKDWKGEKQIHTKRGFLTKREALEYEREFLLKKSKEMLFWTKDEYLKFAEVMKEKPVSYYAFEILYWTGIREGELLALEKGDFDIPGRKLSISKSFQHLQGEDYITSPKTEKSNRVIELPEFLCKEMEDYFGMLYGCDEHTRLFTFSKSYLHHEMDRGAKRAGVKRIRIHDIRHSHASLSQGYF